MLVQLGVFFAADPDGVSARCGLRSCCYWTVESVNNLQIKFAFTFLTLVGVLASVWFFYWAIVYEFMVWQKDVGLALMSSLTNWIYLTFALAFITFTNLLAEEPQLFSQIIAKLRSRLRLRKAVQPRKKRQKAATKEERYPTW